MEDRMRSARTKLIVLALATALAATVTVSASTASVSPPAAGAESLPRLVGARQPGARLRVVSSPDWRRDGTSVTYAWLQCDELDCALITFGSDPELTVPSDLDPARTWWITVVATATADSGTTTTTLSSGPLRATRA
jgi:hypothetical protein